MASRAPEPDPAVPARRRRAWAWPLTAALLGVAIGVHPLWWPEAQALLLQIGKAHLSASGASPRDKESSEYLVVLRDGAMREQAQQFIAARADMRYVTDSIYPLTLVVALPVPVTEAKAVLGQQPFARMVLPVLPIFFCH